jgi:hypothetical protein
MNVVNANDIIQIMNAKRPYYYSSFIQYTTIIIHPDYIFSIGKLIVNGLIFVMMGQWGYTITIVIRIST